MNLVLPEVDLSKSLTALRKGGIILYPTDTIWGLGCDPTIQEAVDRIYTIKERVESKSLIILVDSFERIADYVTEVPVIAQDLVNSINNPVTIIYPTSKNLAKNVAAADGSVAIRIVNEVFCKELIRRFGKPIVSTSANISGEPSPVVFSRVSEYIKSQVDYIVKYKQEVLTQTKPSMIIRLHTSGDYEILRY